MNDHVCTGLPSFLQLLLFSLLQLVDESTNPEPKQRSNVHVYRREERSPQTFNLSPVYRKDPLKRVRAQAPPDVVKLSYVRPGPKVDDEGSVFFSLLFSPKTCR